MTIGGAAEPFPISDFEGRRKRRRAGRAVERGHNRDHFEFGSEIKRPGRIKKGAENKVLRAFFVPLVFLKIKQTKK
jgi:hypothetical protein